MPETPPPLIAHRGFGHKDKNNPVTENTLTAFLRAAAHTQAIELDVRACRDHPSIIFHDDTLERLHPTLSGKITDYTLAQLQRLPFQDGETIPTLDSALELAVKNNLTVHIEIKDPNSTKATYDTILRHPKASAIVSSFNRSIITEMSLYKKSPPLALTYKEAPPIYNVIDDIQLLKLSAIHTSKEGITAEWVKQIHNNKCKVRVYTINNLSDYTKLRAIGVDEFFTDCANLLQNN